MCQFVKPLARDLIPYNILFHLTRTLNAPEHSYGSIWCTCAV